MNQTPVENDENSERFNRFIDAFRTQLTICLDLIWL
jgi:hypothetical protein